MRFSIFTTALISVTAVTATSSYQYSPKIDALLNKIDIAKAQIYDQAGSLRNDVIDTWTDSQLKEWLDAHSLEDSVKNVNVNAKDYATKLREQVLAHKDLLVEDIKSYQAEAAGKADPYIGKSKEFVADTAGKAEKLGKQGQEQASNFLGQIEETLYIQFENAKRAVWDLYEKLSTYAVSKTDL